MSKTGTFYLAAIILVASLALVGAHGAYAQTPLYPTVAPDNTINTATPLTSPTPLQNTNVTPNTLTPGAPNTGAGGDLATNIALLVASAVVAIGGLTYLARSFKTSQ